MADLANHEKKKPKKTGWVASPLPRITTPCRASSAIRAHARASYATHVGCGSDWSRERESNPATQTHDPPRAHATPTPTRPLQTHQKSSTNPLQTATVEIAISRESVLNSARIASPPSSSPRRTSPSLTLRCRRLEQTQSRRRAK